MSKTHIVLLKKEPKLKIAWLVLNRPDKLNALSDAMIDGVVGNKLLPADVRQDIIERTDGIPLFVEEKINYRRRLKHKGFWRYSQH